MLVCLPWFVFGYNPGALKEGNTIIGHPEEAKYGFTREQLFEGYQMLIDKGVKRFGLHTMVASNELDAAYFVETAELLFDLIVEIDQRLGIKIEFANLGGGIGIPYRPADQPVDLDFMSRGIKKLYQEKIEANGLAPTSGLFRIGKGDDRPIWVSGFHCVAH